MTEVKSADCGGQERRCRLVRELDYAPSSAHGRQLKRASDRAPGDRCVGQKGKGEGAWGLRLGLSSSC